MIKNKFAALVAGAALAAMATGCSDTAPRSNANANTVTSNTAVVMNNNGNTNTAGVTTSNTANTNGNYGASNRNYNGRITKEEYDRDKDRYSGYAKEDKESVGSGISDGWIHLKTKASLMTADDLRDSTINVDVDNSVVTLRGTVANAAQKTKAATTAKTIDGVKSVRNQLTVKAAGDSDDDDDALKNKNANANGNANRKG